MDSIIAGCGAALLLSIGLSAMLLLPPSASLSPPHLALCSRMIFMSWPRLISTNERPVSRSRDHSGPMRGGYSCHGPGLSPLLFFHCPISRLIVANGARAHKKFQLVSIQDPRKQESIYCRKLKHALTSTLTPPWVSGQNPILSSIVRMILLLYMSLENVPSRQKIDSAPIYAYSL